MHLNEFKETFFPLKNKLFRFAMQFVKHPDEAADLVQDTFLKLWLKRDSLHTIRNPETFAMTMIKNASIDKLRKNKTLRFDAIKTEPGSTDHTPFEQMEHNETKTQLHKAISLLNEQQRMVIGLRDIEGYEYAEIAEITGMTVNNIRVSLSRARTAIKNTLLKQAQNELVND